MRVNDKFDSESIHLSPKAEVIGLKNRRFNSEATGEIVPPLRTDHSNPPMIKNPPRCRICEGSAQEEQIQVQDLHTGTGGFFDYFICSACDCLQIVMIPEDLSAYYGSDYYSFSRGRTHRHPIREWLIQIRDRFELEGRGLLGRILSIVVPELGLRSLRGLDLLPQTRILEIGCGNGELLQRLNLLGFQDLTGVDPYLPDPFPQKGPIRLCRTLDAVRGPFDLVMLHHSFEHVAEPKPLLQSLAPLLAEHGQLLLRLPLSSSRAFDQYRAHWIQIDAPRHIFLHSEKSLKFLLESTGFRIFKSWQDSTGFQFWGSEQSLKGIPLLHPDSVALRGLNSPFFSWRERIRFERMARELNARGEGDQGVFLARRAIMRDPPPTEP